MLVFVVRRTLLTIACLCRAYYALQNDQRAAASSLLEFWISESMIEGYPLLLFAALSWSSTDDNTCILVNCTPALFQQTLPSSLQPDAEWDAVRAPFLAEYTTAVPQGSCFDAYPLSASGWFGMGSLQPEPHYVGNPTSMAVRDRRFMLHGAAADQIDSCTVRVATRSHLASSAASVRASDAALPA